MNHSDSRHDKQGASAGNHKPESNGQADDGRVMPGGLPARVSDGGRPDPVRDPIEDVEIDLDLLVLPRPGGWWDWVRPDLTGLDPLAVQIVDDTLQGRSTMYEGITGCSKSYNTRRAAFAIARAGGLIVLAEPNILECDSCYIDVERYASVLIEDGVVSRVYGRHSRKSGADGQKYPIHKDTRLIIATQAKMFRRGHSAYASGFWEAIRPNRKKRRPGPFAIMVDEGYMFVYLNRKQIPLNYRRLRQVQRDGAKVHGRHATSCPHKERSGRCEDCVLQPYGGTQVLLDEKWRELRILGSIEVDALGREYRRGSETLDIPESAFGGPPYVRVASTVDARLVERFDEVEVTPYGWRDAEIQTPARDPGAPSAEEPESNRDIIEHMMITARSLILITEFPVDLEGNRLEPAVIAGMSKKERKAVRFPSGPCNCPTVLFSDMLPIEMIRRYQQEFGVGVIFNGAAEIAGGRETLLDGLPNMQFVEVPPSDRKIKQLAVIRMAPGCRLGSLFREDPPKPGDGEGKKKSGTLATIDLEPFGNCVVYANKKRAARRLYGKIVGRHLTCSLVNCNDQSIDYVLYAGADMRHAGVAMTKIAYDRSNLAYGVNLPNLTSMIVDCSCYRRIPSLNPDELTPEGFQRHQAKDQSSILQQVVGRLPRVLPDEPPKVAVLILIDCPDDTYALVKRLPALTVQCELPTLFEEGSDMEIVTDQCVRWLKNGGGNWPEPDPTKSRSGNAGRPPAEVEELMERARTARRAGVTWKVFTNSIRFYKKDKSVQELIRSAYNQAT